MAVMNRLRQINFLQVFLCHSVMWYVSIFFFLWTGGSGIITPGAALICSFMVPSLIAFMAGVIITYRALSGEKRRPWYYMVIAVVVLAAVDQGIKLAVIRNQDAVVPIIDGWLEYRVAFNAGHFLNRRGIYISDWVYMILPIIVLGIYRMLVFHKRNAGLISTGIILLFPAVLSSWADKLFYGGSYDYIFMNQFGYFDLKDIFAFTAFCTLIQAVIYEQPMKKLKKETLQDPFGVQYLRHEYGNIKKRFSEETKEEL